MKKTMLKILIALCVIVGAGSFVQCARVADPSASSSSSSSSSSSGGGVTQIELSDDELIF